MQKVELNPNILSMWYSGTAAPHIIKKNLLTRTSTLASVDK